MWKENGFGPWAFTLDDEFIGWGDLQLEGDDVDVGLVLSRKYWGAGPTLYRRILTHAFKNSALTLLLLFYPQVGQGSLHYDGWAFAKMAKLCPKTSISFGTSSSEAADESE